MSENIFEFADHCAPQLVPASAWSSNLRAIMTDAKWREFRELVFIKHGKICAFCGASPKSLDCHEIWKYVQSDKFAGIQSLVKVLPLCKPCHMVCHIGFWSLKGKFEQVLAHMMRVRKISRGYALAEISAANELFEKLSSVEWELDVSAAETYISLKKDA